MTAPPSPSSRGRALALGVSLVVCAALAVLVGLGVRAASRAERALADARRSAGVTHTTVVRVTPSVVTAVRELARLETAQYHVERVIDLADRQEALFGLVDARDAILLVAAADVTAGVDLGALGDGDVTVDAARQRAVIRLPPPAVFATALDNARTYVHSRTTDTLARRQEDLETRARRIAETSLRDAAIEAGILRRAREGAERSVRALVRSLGYREVVIEWRE